MGQQKCELFFFFFSFSLFGSLGLLAITTSPWCGSVRGYSLGNVARGIFIGCKKASHSKRPRLCAVLKRVYVTWVRFSYLPLLHPHLRYIRPHFVPGHSSGSSFFFFFSFLVIFTLTYYLSCLSVPSNVPL